MSDDWKQDARCAQIGGDFWFPEPGGSNVQAKRICGGCPVSAQCLEAALSLPPQLDTHGIFGGLSPLERRRLRKAAA